jgi:hypothetical protein
MKGLLIRSIETLMKMDPKMQKDPNLRLVLAKSRYEQGLMPESLQNLFEVMKEFPAATQAVDAGDLILDYFNTRSDFTGLEYWANQMAQLKLPQIEFNDRLAKMRELAKSKVVQEKVRSVSGYDEFAQGRSYLSVAIQSQDEGIANEVLKEAIAKSKKEKDLETFIKAAQLLGDKEKDPAKQFEIRKSLAREYMKMTRYYQSQSILSSMLNDPKLSSKQKGELLDELLNQALLLRDWDALSRYLSNPAWTLASANVKIRLKEQLTDLLESPLTISETLQNTLLTIDSGDETLVSFYKAQSKLSPSVKSRATSEFQRRCAESKKTILCRWMNLEQFEVERTQFAVDLQKAPPTMEYIESFGKKFQDLSARYQSLEVCESVRTYSATILLSCVMSLVNGVLLAL